MTTLNVGPGQTYSTIAAAVNAAQNGDTINVQAGTYTNDFVNVYKSVSFNAVGGMVTMSATVQPPNGKGIVDEGGPGVSVSFNGFAFTGATVNDANGAGIRYEGGNLTVTNSHFFNNQDGILANPDPNGTISISASEFNNNGAGDGYSHNIYINDIAKFTLTNSYIHDAKVGHEIKSRAETTVITNNRIFDNNSTSSYEIDVPNGGNTTISGNIIEQGPNSENPNIIAYGEEGNLHSNSTLSVTGNTIINDRDRGPALWNASSAGAIFQNNAVYGFGSNALVNGSASQSGTTVLTTRPTLDTSAPYTVPGGVSPPAGTKAGLVLSVSEDAWQGDAQYTVAIDGVQTGGIRTVTASHAAGASQQIGLGLLPAGQHSVAVTFLNDAWGGTPATDRNLYVNGATYNDTAVPGATTVIGTNSTSSFLVAGDQPTAGLVMQMSEDAWQGDALFTVSVDGVQQGGVRTVTASHAAGQTQAVLVDGSFTPGSHAISVNFLNDAWGGTAATDRNLYVDRIDLGGVANQAAFATLGINGPTTLTATTDPAAAASAAAVAQQTLVLHLAQDVYGEDAKFLVSIDGKALGGVASVHAAHGSASQAFSFTGAFGVGPHDVAVTFLNDAWGGTTTTDRNLYLTGAELNGHSYAGATAALFSAGTQHVTIGVGDRL